MDKAKITNGPLLKTLIAFAIPFIMVNLVQRLFHVADVAILGIMATDADVAAVGACGSIISMMVCLFSGYSSAANVVVAKRVGAQDEYRSRRATGTALVLGVLSGVILMVSVMIFARQILILTKCQEDVLDMATLYMRIYFAGMPITMLYNFVAALLRATGDSVKPMIYMMICHACAVWKYTSTLRLRELRLQPFFRMRLPWFSDSELSPAIRITARLRERT